MHIQPAGQAEPEIRTLHSRVIYTDQWTRFRKDDIERCDGSRGTYAVVERDDSVLIIPADDGGFHLVEEYRYPVGQRSWSFPQGGFPPGETGTPEELARLELSQEAGLHAERLTHLGRLTAAQGMTSQRCDYFLATGLTSRPPNPEPEEIGIQDAWVSRDEFEEMIRDGRVTDDSTLAAYALLLIAERRGDLRLTLPEHPYRDATTCGFEWEMVLRGRRGTARYLLLTYKYWYGRVRSLGPQPDRRVLTVASKSDAKPGKSRGFVGVLPYLFDLIVPLVSYYTLTGAGLSPFWALVTGGGITAVLALVTTVRRGRIDKLGVLVILEIALGITLDLTIRSARLTLARGSLFILVAGVWILVTAFTDRPAAMDATKGFAARKGGRKGIDAFEWLAVNSAPFMRVQRRLTCVWSVVFIAYATGRVILVYSVSISQAVWLDAFPAIAAFVICMAASAQAGKKLETMVYARMNEMDATEERRRDQALTQDLQ